MKLIILDRDGVINHDSDDYIKSENEWEAIPGSLDAIARLNRGGYRIVVATNQSGLARGQFDVNTLRAMFHESSRRLRVPLYKTTFSGDKLSDMEAALTVKAKPVLVKTGYGQTLVESGKLPDGITVFDDLASVADSILEAA